MSMPTATRITLALMTSVLLLLPSLSSVAEAGPASRSVSRVGAAVGRAAKTRVQRLARIAWLDRKAHQRAVERVLAAPRRVFRYTSTSGARQALRRGFDKVTHFTTRVWRGRPLSAVNAQRRFGLPTTPTRRLDITLPAGTPVKTLRVNGGARNARELINTRPIPRASVRMSVTEVR